MITRMGIEMYLTDTEIRERLNIPEKRWSPAVQHFERQGFPRRDPLVGKRYWPAVEVWLLKRYSDGFPLRNAEPEEMENWDALKRYPRARS